MSSSSLPAFGPSCPRGGTWYACNTGDNFVGCCTANPCSSTCQQGNLKPASFIASRHGTFTDASCPANSNFYTCNTTSPVFMGCCKSGTNPCASPGSCDADNLVPAFLGTESLKQQYGAVAAGSSSSSSASATVARASTLATMATSSPSSTGTSASQASPAPITQKDGPPVAAIAGGAAGGAFAIALVIGLLIYYCCHAKKSRKGHEETVVRRESDLAAMATPMNIQGKAYGSEMNMGVGSPDAPPSYMSPNPNDYYGAHAHQQAGRYHQYIPEPQEMPCDTQGTGMVGFSGKPVGHQRNLSELSGETTIRSEMESPQVGTNSTPIEPQAGWSNSPSGYSGLTWTPQQNWQTQTGDGHAYGSPQGLGLNGNEMNHRTTPR